MRDFDKSSGDRVVQQTDKHTGLPLWVIEVIDADPEARQRTVKVTGSPFVPVEFEGHHQPRQRRGHRGRREVRPPVRRGRGPVRGRTGQDRRPHPARGPRPGPCRAGGVMALKVKAGRLELVPPAAPGFSPQIWKWKR